MSNPIIAEVVEQMEYLPDNLQQQVLEFVYKLKAATTPGISGKALLRFAGAIPLADLEQMSQAIERDCEQVDLDEW
jgi:hypothetical protein